MEATKQVQAASQTTETEPVPFIVSFSQNSARHPNRKAIVTSERTISYGQLNQAANQLANKILALRGEREEPIAFLSGLEIDSIVAILGIWKAAKFYVGLDPSNSPDRLRSILDDSDVHLLITNGAHMPLAKELAEKGIGIINIDELGADVAQEAPALSLNLDAIAAIYYTSGSTGKPKGVIHTQRGLAHRAGRNDRVPAGDRILMPFSPSFLWGFARIHMALFPGGTLYLLDYNSMTLADIARWFIDNKITSVAMTGSMFSQFLSLLPAGLPKFPDMRLINIGGEAFNPKDLEVWKKHFSPPCVISTSLSSTEGGALTRTIYDFKSTVGDVQAKFRQPEPGTKIYILDDNGRPLKTGETGRIGIRNNIISAGYWRRPDLNQDLFVPDPENSEGRILVSRDLGRLHEDGSLEFIGRGDAMLKIRGFRVEPGEIETALRKNEGVQDAVIAGRRPPHSPEEIVLVAYIVRRPEWLVTIGDLRAFLTTLLPHYMVPSYYVFVDKFPRTHNGKVDRQGLPDPDWTSNSQEFEAAHTELQNYLVELWQKVLKKKRVGVKDDFFMLGGHSLAAFRITSEIQETLGHKLPLQVLIAHPTIESLAKVIQENTQATFAPASVTTVRKPSGGAPALFMVPGAARTSVSFSKLTHEVSPSIGIYGLEYPGMGDYLEPIADTKELAAFFMQQILTVQPQGTFHLGGQCYGGVIAFEIAQQLATLGHPIGSVTLIDSSPPGMRDDELDSRDILYYLRRARLMLQRDNRAGILPFLTLRLNRLLNPFRSSGNKLAQLSWTENSLDDASLRVAHAVTKAIRKARDTYKPKKLSARGLVLLSGVSRGSAREAWWRRLFDQLECHYIPNTAHSTILSAEHSRQQIGNLISQMILEEPKINF